MDSTKQEPTDEVYIMDDTENYIKFSLAITTPVIESILDEFEDECRKMKGKCLDIGCGAGNYSRELILPRLSPECSLVGVDISENMIDCARKLCADEKRITFKVMDIETTDLKIEDIEAYDNGFSFFCLHWLRDLRCGFENIFKLLTPGGNMIALLVVESCMLFAYPKLAEYPQYKEYMKDYSRYITSIHYEKNPLTSLKKICQEVGFEVIHLSKRESVPGFKNEGELMKFLVTLNPFIGRMPESMRDEYKRDLLQESLKHGQFYKRVGKHASQEQNLFGEYKYMVIHLKKPNI
ncbi:juvenile hormone acid O-methyltransferase-like [Belonocnema kinseyi]|uniref:juvenile hormone acid O-methyltransferase-like n=1 Tax=Belonocnema kinseyi TaxID=2817044 RepID=UPI00143DFB78|nr:juvenile hormone acid O-methyltransferase-like [Belonocnema kinseyi]XP_033226595.1 juvenile hormone acid O-methyltransferase-like [Belonocnema kinseyi]